MKESIKFCSIILCFLLSININLTAQNSTIEWGDKLENKGAVEFIGENEDHLFATQLKTGMLSISYKLITIDKKTLQIVKSNKIPISIFSIPLDLSIADDKFQILEVRKGKQFRKKIYDLDMNEISNELVTKFDKFVHNALLYEGYKMLFPVDVISSFRSADKSKVSVMLIKVGKDRGGVELFTFDIKSGLTQLNHTNLKGSRGSSMERVADTDLSSNGTINLLMKRYKDGKGEQKNKKPNYDYALYKVGLDGEQTNTSLPLQEKFWDNAYIKSLDDESNIVVGLLKPGYKKAVNQFRTIKLNNDNDIVFDELHLLYEGEFNKTDQNLYIRNIITKEDGSFVLLSEYAWGVTFTNANGQSEKDRFYARDIFVDGFGTDGSKLWEETLYRYIEEKGDTRMFSGSLAVNLTEGLSIYLNTTEKNIDPLNKEKQKSEKLPSKKPVVFVANVAKDGGMTLEQLSKGNKLNISTRTSLISENSLYFIGAKDNKLNKVFVGRLGI